MEADEAELARDVDLAKWLELHATGLMGNASPIHGRTTTPMPTIILGGRGARHDIPSAHRAVFSCVQLWLARMC